MKLFEIRDDDLNDMLVGYLQYYPKSESFFIELPEGIAELDAPFMFARQVREKRYSVDKYWSRKWVNSRIIPPDRQNIGEILRVNGLKYYDPFKLLVIADGRCAQDECYINKADVEKLPDWYHARMKKSVKDIIPLHDNSMVVFFEDETTRKVDVNEIKGEDRTFARVLKDGQIFASVDVMSGGHGVQWGEERYITADVLYNAGEQINLPFEYILSFVNNRVVDTGEICDIMDCSRQYINRLLAYGKLVSLKSGANNRLYLKSDAEKENFLQKKVSD